MKQFNKEQLKAIRHGDGPMMVLAGPGSGKTTVLVNRVLYLTEELKIPEKNILVITFTRASAKEMEERYLREKAMKSRMESENTGAENCGQRNRGPEIGRGYCGPRKSDLRSCRGKALKNEAAFGTFHSVFFSILRDRLGFRNEDVAEGKACMELMWKVLCSPGIRDHHFSTDMAALFLSELGSRKNGVVHKDYPVSEEVFAEVEQAYETAMKRRGLLDFDDMLIKLLILLRRDRELLSALRSRYRYIMIDEFQDINPTQYEIIRLLCEPLRNIFIVGDDDQSIYGFRGSDPGIMLHFPEDFPELDTVTLGINYRSESRIVEASLRLIEHNKSRYRKDLRPCPEKSGNGRGIISIREAADEKEEARLVASEISERLRYGGKVPSIAVLFRVHRAARELMKELEGRGISIGGSRGSELMTLQRGGRGPELMTFHGAKGLEFDIVYIISANEGITPWKLAKDGVQLEEERRMFYVAMTRARSELHIFNTKLLYSRTQKRTEYIDELSPEGFVKAVRRRLRLLEKGLRDLTGGRL